MFTHRKWTSAIVLWSLTSLVVLGTVALPRAQAGPGGNRFAAIAYSEQTGRYGYVYGRACLADAQAGAIANCGAPDAHVVIWVQNGWVALARSPNGAAYGCGWSTCSLADAEATALRGCALHGCPGIIAAWASSS